MSTARWLLLVALVAAGSSPVAAQTAPHRGVVIDGQTGLAIAGARITVLHRDSHAVSDAQGRFTITLANPFADTLQIARLGYVPVRLVGPITDAALHVALDASPVVLPAIVSVASRRPQSTAEIAVPVIAVNQEEIVTSGALSLDRLLQEMPALQQSSEPPARSTLMIRGIGGSRVLVLVDGEPVPGAMVEDRDLSRISLSSAEQVEIVKGPLAAIYGSEAIGGVINVMTRLPEGPFALRGDVSGGSAGRRTAMLEAGSGGAVPWRISLAHRGIDQINTQVSRPGVLQRVWDLRGSAHTQLAPTLRLRIDGSAFRERQRWPVDGTMNAFNDNNAFSGWAEAELDRGATQWRARISAQRFAHQYREAAGPVPFAGTGAPIQRELSGRLLLTGTRDLGGGHQVDIGTDLSARRVDAPDRLIGGSLDDTGIDAWISDAWHTGALLLTGAVRHGWSSRWGSTVTPALSGALQPTPALRFRASVARGFRGPSFKENGWSFSNPTAGYLIEGNPDLQPERSWQYSTGVAWQPRDATVIDLEVYRNDLRDLIDLRFVGVNPAGLQRYRSTNVANAMTQGLDLSVQQQLAGTRLVLAWSWLGSRDGESGEPLPQRVPHSIRLSASRGVGPLALSGVGRWVAAVEAGSDGSSARAAFLAWDTALRIAVIRELELRAGVDNIFDARPAGWQAPIGRTVRIEATTTWRP